MQSWQVVTIFTTSVHPGGDLLRIVCGDYSRCRTGIDNAETHYFRQQTTGVIV